MARAKMVFPAVLCLAVFSFTPQAATQEPEFKKSPYFKAIALSYQVVDESSGDLDGDGIGEHAVAYRQAADAVGVSGGLLILSERAGGMRLAWHAFFRGFYPKGARISGRALQINFIQVTDKGEEHFSHTLEYGKQLYFRWDKDSPFYGVKISASSTLKKGGLRPEIVFDGDLRSAWAEGVEGTGVGERLTFEFSQPVDLALIGLLPGNVSSKKDWLENNRVHRADVTVETHADRFDTGTDVDLDRDLGLGLYGDIVEMEFSNQPVLRYFQLEKEQVVSLEIKIRSVLLGEKFDDTYVAEVDFAELFSRQSLEKLLRGEKEPPPAPKTEPPSPRASPAPELEEEEEGF